MISRIPFVSLPLPDSDRKERTQLFPVSRQSDFLNLLVKTIGNGEAGKAAIPAHHTQSFRPLELLGPASIKATANPMSRNDIIRFVMTQEGSRYIAQDGGSESSRYGILQSTAERFGYQGSVKDMSKKEAEAIYEKLWKDSGAQNLKPDLALVHFDTYVNSPSAARKMLKACDGNADDYLSMRSTRYSRLSSLRPERYEKYFKGWMNRIENLRSMVAQNNYLSPTKATT
jgi:lysozyme family protein